MATATNETFTPSGTSGQLKIGGNNVTANASVTNIKRTTSWEGQLTLSTSSRTNLCTYSQDLTNAAWSVLYVTRTGGYTAPDGSSTMVRINETVDNGNHYILSPTITFSSGVVYKFRFWMSKASTRSVGMEFGGNGSAFPTYSMPTIDPSTGNIYVDGTVFTAGTSTDVGSFWLIELTTAAAAANGTDFFDFILYNGSYSYAGNTGQFVELWGFQVTSAADVGAYIATTSSTASVTDYSYTSAGVVTLGQSATGTYVWNGTGDTAAASTAFQPNAFQSSSFQASTGGAATGTPSGVSGAAEVGTATAVGIRNATTSPTGVAGTGAVGTATVTLAPFRTPTGQAGTGQVGTPTATISPFATPTGQAGTGQVGSPTATLSPFRTPTGVAGTGAIGTPTISAGCSVVPNGVAGAGAVGTPTAGVMTNATATPAGVAGTGQVGTAIVSAGCLVVPNGVSGTAQVGTAVPLAIKNVSGTPAGVAGTGAVGNPVVTLAPFRTPSGVTGSAAVGNVVPLAIQNPTTIPAGVQGTAQVGAAVAQAAGGATALPAGVSGTGAVGTATPSASCSRTPTGVSGTGAVGTAIANGAANVVPLGVQATGAVGTPAVSAGCNVVPLGVVGTAQVGAATAFSEAPLVTDPDFLVYASKVYYVLAVAQSGSFSVDVSPDTFTAQAEPVVFLVQVPVRIYEVSA